MPEVLHIRPQPPSTAVAVEYGLFTAKKAGFRPYFTATKGALLRSHTQLRWNSSRLSGWGHFLGTISPQLIEGLGCVRWGRGWGDRKCWSSGVGARVLELERWSVSVSARESGSPGRRAQRDAELRARCRRRCRERAAWQCAWPPCRGPSPTSRAHYRA